MTIISLLSSPETYFELEWFSLLGSFFRVEVPTALWIQKRRARKIPKTIDPKMV
jgi:hypothetical protein